jgi:RNA polymerase sigma factor (sigma-70 family)
MPAEPLIFLLRKNDQEAWSKAWNDLYPIALRVAKSKTLNLDEKDAEEVVATVMREIVNKVKSVDIYEGLKPLTITITQRRSKDHLTRINAIKRGREITGSLTGSKREGDDYEIQVDSGAPTPSQELEKADRIKYVREFLNNELNSPVKDVMQARFIEGLSGKDISEKLEMPINTVNVYILRGLERLRNKIEENPEWEKVFRDLLR